MKKGKLTQMVEQITPENRYPETSTGVEIGREAVEWEPTSQPSESEAIKFIPMHSDDSCVAGRCPNRPEFELVTLDRMTDDGGESVKLFSALLCRECAEDEINDIVGVLDDGRTLTYDAPTRTGYSVTIALMVLPLSLSASHRQRLLEHLKSGEAQPMELKRKRDQTPEPKLEDGK